jgi:hypothetical protein
MQKTRKEEEKETYLQAPTFATTLKILLLSHSCCHHIETLLVGAILKLQALDFMLLNVRVIVMELSIK